MKMRKADPSVQEMRTPPWLFELLSVVYGPFILDAFASAENALCHKFWTEAENGLERHWAPGTFWNSPFEISKLAAEKACYELNEYDRGSVGIIPAGCSQQWFHRYVVGQALVLWPDQRIQFCAPDGTPKKGNNRDTMVVVYDTETMPSSGYAEPLEVRYHQENFFKKHKLAQEEWANAERDKQGRYYER